MPVSDLSLFDSHCHFDFEPFDEQRNQLWAQCQQAGVRQLLIPGVEPKRWAGAYAISQQYSGIVMAAGLHPWWVKQAKLPEADEYGLMLARDRCVAIGECGLDAAIDTPLEQQQPVFEAQLQMAVNCAMPVVVHVRQTHQQTMALLKHYRPPKGGVIHGFSGSYELAMRYWAMGFYLGIGGSITYPRASKTRSMVQQMPLEALLLETDAPDMPLYGYQGQANSPLKLLNVAQVLAELRGEPLAVIAQATSHNSTTLFGLS